MASTYTLISSQVLASTTASVTFSSIPATYTDLVLRVSARSDNPDTNDAFYIKFNGSSSAVYSNTTLIGNGATASSSRLSSNTSLRFVTSVDGSTATSNTFGNAEIYIPSYLASQNKPISNFAVQENNNATAYINITAGLFSDTTAISSISLTPLFATVGWVSGSSFYLYGIKSS